MNKNNTSFSLYDAQVLSSVRLADDIYSLTISANQTTGVPGQFALLYPADAKTLLPRPISICGVDTELDALRLVYRVVGGGTEEFSRLTTNDKIRVMSPLGNGFPLSEAKRALLFGGGIGIPPMLFLAERLKKMGVGLSAFLGYRGTEGSPFLAEEFEGLGEVFCASENGAFGIRGNVFDAYNFTNIDITKYDTIYACGPLAMLKAVKAFADKNNLRAYISLEEHMACGVGACLGCSVKTVKKDGHFKVCRQRVCADGPVFCAGEVEM